MKEALLYKKLPEKKVQCQTCSHYCVIPEGELGFCRVRLNKKGKLYSTVYGKAVSATIDPIEKKPLYHFLPGTGTFSIATAGCNFRCKHCQNWQISQATVDGVPYMNLPPKKVVAQALKADCKSIAYTYTEPTVFFEYCYDTMQLAVKKGLFNVFVSNGFMSKETRAKCGDLHALNIDIKGNERFYKEVCGARLEPVLESVKAFKKQKKHVEVTNLIIPGYNDNDESYQQIAEFATGIDPLMPLHFTAFYPFYRMTDVEPTSRAALVQARKIAIENGVKYVYCGNTGLDEPFGNTFCHNCGHLIVKRYGMTVVSIELDNGKCPNCRKKIPIFTG